MLNIFFYNNYDYCGADPEVVEKPGDMSLSKLKNLYIQAKDLAETEVRYFFITYKVLHVIKPSA